jgi:FtsZ-interacting cell division protein ZipA
LLPILSGLIEISVYSCGELRKAGSERKIDMKKLVIILAIAIMLFAILKQRTEQPATVAVGASQNAATGSPKELPETHTEQVEQITEATSEPAPTEATEEETAVQSPMKKYAEETETQKSTEPEETVECVDKGDQTLAEYKSQSSRQPNPFENAPPTEIVDHPVEDIIGEGDDLPGEGKHF